MKVEYWLNCAIICGFCGNAMEPKPQRQSDGRFIARFVCENASCPQRGKHIRIPPLTVEAEEE